MIHSNGMTAVLQWTTPTQLKLVVDELIQRYNEVRVLIDEAEKSGGFVTKIDFELEQLYNGLENMLCDLEVPGFEREDFPHE